MCWVHNLNKYISYAKWCQIEDMRARQALRHTHSKPEPSLSFTAAYFAAHARNFINFQLIYSLRDKISQDAFFAHLCHIFFWRVFMLLYIRIRSVWWFFSLHICVIITLSLSFIHILLIILGHLAKFTDTKYALNDLLALINNDRFVVFFFLASTSFCWSDFIWRRVLFSYFESGFSFGRCHF